MSTDELQFRGTTRVSVAVDTMVVPDDIQVTELRTETKLVNSVLRLIDSCNCGGIAVLNLRPKSFMRKREFHIA